MRFTSEKITSRTAPVKMTVLSMSRLASKILLSGLKAWLDECTTATQFSLRGSARWNKTALVDRKRQLQAPLMQGR